MKDSKPRNSKDGAASRSSQKAPWILVGVIAVVVVVAAGVAIYLDRVAPFRTTIVSVDGQGVSMRTFIRRAKLSGQEPLAMLQKLAEEQVVKLVAPNPPYNVQVDDEDIDSYLRQVARGDSASITETDFKEWYRQQLNESRLSDDEFRDLVRTNLLMRGLQEYLAERVPTVAEQVHLFMIPVEDIAAARAVRERLLAGEDFARVAREASIDEGVRQTGGEIGWFPRGALLSYIARAAFDELEVGEISEPLLIGEENFAIVKVADRAMARDLDDTARRRLQERALQDWLVAEQRNHEVEFHGFSGAYDSETDAWVKWQLARMKRHDE